MRDGLKYAESVPPYYGPLPTAHAHYASMVQNASSNKLMTLFDLRTRENSILCQFYDMILKLDCVILSTVINYSN